MKEWMNKAIRGGIIGIAIILIFSILVVILDFILPLPIGSLFIEILEVIYVPKSFTVMRWSNPWSILGLFLKWFILGAIVALIKYKFRKK